MLPLSLVQVLLPGDAHVLELLVDLEYLLVVQREGWTVAQVPDRCELVDHEGLSVVLVDSFQKLLKLGVGDRVYFSLLGLEVQNRAANLEEVLNHVFGDSFKVTVVCVDVKLFLLLVEDRVDLQRLESDGLLVDEEQVAEDLDDVDLV